MARPQDSIRGDFLLHPAAEGESIEFWARNSRSKLSIFSIFGHFSGFLVKMADLRATLQAQNPINLGE
jgi:hypothetical protein